MRIDIQVAAHLREQVPANILLSVLKSSVSRAVIEAAVTALSLVGYKAAREALRSRSLRTRRSNSEPFTVPLSDTGVRVSRPQVVV